ncbi:MAG: type II toxin-antitoxin system RelE/ParE family toxin [Planctomycetaceae bacterium]
MSYRVRLLSLAREDTQQIFDWLAQREPRGAEAWYNALQVRLAQLREDADGCAVAAESRQLGEEVRETFFKTRQGNRYRIVFSVSESEVRIHRVRAPGLRPLRQSDLSDEN